MVSVLKPEFSKCFKRILYLAKIPNQASNTIMQAKRSFMIEHELEDAQAAYVEAIYNFRKAERGEGGNYDSARRYMNQLEKKIQDLRYKMYSNNAA